MANPVIVEVTRGGIVESMHRGAWCICDSGGAIIASSGDTGRAVFPRSAIKALQALAVIEAGTAEKFGFTNAQIALACASHAGEPAHVEVAESMLDKIGLSETAYECGAHWPSFEDAAHDLAREGAEPRSIHNNCSGKHAGMLALALHLGVNPAGYVKREHAVQKAVAATIGEMCEIQIEDAPCGIDGCSIPTWAIPLDRLATGFAKFGSGAGLGAARQAAAKTIIAAVRAEPFMVAGTGRFCTDVMRAVPEVFVKTGAEGVFCGTIPATGIGIALKCDDGATRAAECLMAHLLSRHGGLDKDASALIDRFTRQRILNRAGLEVGEVRIAGHS